MEFQYRKWMSVAVGIAAFFSYYFFLFPTGCAAVADMPSIERCYSLAGRPAFSVEDWGLSSYFDILQPLAAGVVAGLITRKLLQLMNP